MSIYVQNYVWKLDLPPTVKYVAIALADHAHDDGYEARPSQAYLSDKTGLTVRHIRRCLKDLRDRHVIEVQRPAGRGRCTVYRFISPPEGFAPAAKDGRTSGLNRRTSTTIKADTHVPLTISNPYKEIEDAQISVSDEFRADKIVELRKSLRQRR